MITLYGLSTCSTCKKAMAWLDDRKVPYRFVDYRAQPIAADHLRSHAATIGWERLVNRASTTWRNLSDAEKSPPSDADWLALVEAYPTLIRRPLMVADDGTVMAGFRAKQYAARFGA